MVVKSGKPKASQSQAAGRARQASVASVTTASVPSEPVRSRRRSGPAAERGTGRQRRISPSGRTAVSPSSTSSIAPNPVEACPADDAAIQPPTVEIAIDCG